MKDPSIEILHRITASALRYGLLCCGNPVSLDQTKEKQTMSEPFQLVTCAECGESWMTRDEGREICPDCIGDCLDESDDGDEE